jgi:hypothetical protein
MIRSPDYSNLIPGTYITLNDQSQVCSRSQCLGKTAREELVVHPNTKPPARDPWLGYFKDCGADRPPLADERIVHRDSFRREIFPKLAVLKRSTEFFFPPPRVFYGVRVHHFIGPPVRFAIRLIVAVEIYSTNGYTTVDRRFPNGAFGRPAVIVKLARPSNIDR